MKWFTLLIPTVLLVGCVLVLNADTILVPSQQPTIQAGIDVAVDGDTVLVANGIYQPEGWEGIDFLGKAIVVMSENGADSCIIDCDLAIRGFHFHNGEDTSSVVQGFTIINGFGGPGGGIYCRDNSSPTISDNTIMGNISPSGGGIFCGPYSSPIITGNTIMGNEAGWSGGGICSMGGSPTITDNTIMGNLSTGDQGGGGGIKCFGNSSPTITGNMILWNTSTSSGGGGIHCGYSSPIIEDNIIAGNTASGVDGYGGGIHCTEGFPTITGNTITVNMAEAGGGIYCGYSSPTITNCILWGDSPDEIYVVSGNPVATYSNIQGGWPGEGNIDEDPMFVLPIKDDLRLLWGSQCIDTGDPILLDPDGTRSDMGAHYFNQDDYLTLYLTPDATEVQPGSELGVTYTSINRWEQPEPFWVLSQVTLPGGNTGDVVGPFQYDMPADTTIQVYLTHDIPVTAPTGMYNYWSRIGLPPGTLYDDDSFKFWVLE